MDIHCPECNFTQSIRDEKIPPDAVNATCPRCRTRFKFRALPQDESRYGQFETAHDAHTPSAHPPFDQNGTPLSPEEETARRKAASDAYVQAAHSGQSPIAWEAELRSNPPAAFFKTLAEIVLRPSAFFAKIPYSSQLAQPILFSIIPFVLALIGTIIIFKQMPVPDSAQFPQEAALMQQLHTTSWWLLVIDSLPLFFAVNIILAIACHVALRILHPATADMRVTLRVIAYTNAAWIFSFIPIVNILAMPVLLCLGLRAAHKLSLNTALIATLTAIFGLFVATVLLASLFAG